MQPLTRIEPWSVALPGLGMVLTAWSPGFRRASPLYVPSDDLEWMDRHRCFSLWFFLFVYGCEYVDNFFRANFEELCGEDASLVQRPARSPTHPGSFQTVAQHGTSPAIGSTRTVAWAALASPHLQGRDVTDEKS